MRRALVRSPTLAVASGALGALRPLKAADLHVYQAAARSYFRLSRTHVRPEPRIRFADALPLPSLVSLPSPTVCFSSAQGCGRNMGRATNLNLALRSSCGHSAVLA
jgi:hypothetical protein